MTTLDLGNSFLIKAYNRITIIKSLRKSIFLLKVLILGINTLTQLVILFLVGMVYHKYRLKKNVLLMLLACKKYTIKKCLVMQKL